MLRFGEALSAMLLARRITIESRTPQARRRHFVLCTIAIAGMAVLGVAALATQWLKEGWLTIWWRPQDAVGTVLLCAIIGAIVGLPTVVCVVPCLRRKNLWLAVPLVYGVGLHVVAWYTYSKPTGMYGPLTAAIPALLTVCAASVIVYFVLPNRVTISSVGCCPECNYDLRGDFSHGCPECGWRRAAKGAESQ